MFFLAIVLGLYSYSIFSLGLLGLLGKESLIVDTVFFLAVLVSYFWKTQKNIVRAVFSFFRTLSVLSFCLIGLLAIQALINLVGVLGPELGFDALWYHLTLPKLYLETATITFIPGGLLYYSAMPKLAEMLYIPGLLAGGEQFIKLIHFSFGILTCIAIYHFSRNFFARKISLIAVAIFYANLVVGWESSSAYIDLVRTFFEVLGLWGFINWWKKRKKHWLFISAVMIGFAITTKLLAIGSLILFLILIGIRDFRTVRVVELVRDIALYPVIALLVPLPWFLFAYYHTGTPLYPFFTDLYKVAPEPLSLAAFIKDISILFTSAADPISPVYLIVLPLLLWIFIKRQKSIKQIEIIKPIVLYSLLAIIIWYFTPRTGGGRFILPYVPAFSILVAFVLSQIPITKLRLYLVSIVILLSVTSILYRGAANSRYLPFILGKESKAQFLKKHLNFEYGDFYDIDGYFAKKISQNDRVLLYGFHNLYYIDFPYIDSSWVKKGDKYNYIATQGGRLPEERVRGKLIYENPVTHVRLYSLGTFVSYE